MGKGDLHVKEHSNPMRDEDKSNSDWPVGKGEPHKAVSEPDPVANHHGDFNGSCPPR